MGRGKKRSVLAASKPAFPKCRTCGDNHEWPRGNGCAVRKAVLGLDMSPKDKEVKDTGYAASQAAFQQRMESFMSNIEGRIGNLEKRSADPMAGGPLNKKPKHSDLAQSDSSSSESESEDEVSDQVGLPKPSDLAKSGKKKATHQRILNKVPGLGADKFVPGEQRTALDLPVVNIPWPQDFVLDTNLKHDELQLHQFMYGYLEMIRREPSKAKYSHMFEHLMELMIDLENHRWEQVRAYNRLIFHEIQAGRLTWGDSAKKEWYRSRYAYMQAIPQPVPQISHVSVSQKKPSASASTNDSASTPCIKYNYGTCQQAAGHGNFAHCCMVCWLMKKKAYPHPEYKCERKVRATKNDAAKGSPLKQE